MIRSYLGGKGFRGSVPRNVVGFTTRQVHVRDWTIYSSGKMLSLYVSFLSNLYMYLSTTLGAKYSVLVQTQAWVLMCQLTQVPRRRQTYMYISRSAVIDNSFLLQNHLQQILDTFAKNVHSLASN